ncbi:MAG: Nramp family divalent metal transporter [Bacteroidota bacterium]|nr:Nramp family divalent metal transporter [Bacteroidota bacterium]
MINKLKNLGPGIIITSAFIGPGTVTICTLAGINYGYSLIWCIIFSILATCYLQEISSRLGIISRKGLSEILIDIDNTLIRRIIIGIIFLSLFVGNAAYESGNISGTVMGLETFIGSIDISLLNYKINFIPIIIGSFLAIIIGNGSYKFFEKVLVFLVFTMSITFVLVAIISTPSIEDLLSGLKPDVTENNFIYVVGLIGTTVVPYNLFLHSYVAKKKWVTKKDYKTSVFDTVLSIVIGGIISLSIIITAASSQVSINQNEIKNAVDLGTQLSPTLGSFSKYFISIGLFCAGITSSITAPIATSYALSGIFKYKAEWSDKVFKRVAYIIIIIGVVFSSINYNPILVIKLAQFVNGLFLPFIAIFLIWSVNKRNIMGNYVNSKFYNLLGILIVLISIVISYRSLILI